MNFVQIWLYGLAAIMILMAVLWVVSIIIRNAGIVDIFWGIGFVLASVIYFTLSPGNDQRKLLVLFLTFIWGLRLSIHIAWRNRGRGEDFRYRQFRKNYGAERYWWISFFQVFLLQGTLLWLVSSTLLGGMYVSVNVTINWLAFAGIAVWLTGLFFETAGDYQLARFKADPANRGKVLSSGLWRYTRHPNYFGDSAVWWGFGLISISAGNWLPALGSLLMTILIIKVSGVVLLEKSLIGGKEGYKEYIQRTSAFIPWFPRKWNR